MEQDGGKNIKKKKQKYAWDSGVRGMESKGVLRGGEVTLPQSAPCLSVRREISSSLERAKIGQKWRLPFPRLAV